MLATVLAIVTTAVMILAHLAGLVISIILLAKKKGTAAILATVAFALLFLLDIGRIALPFLQAALIRIGSGDVLVWGSRGASCCCGLFDLAAIVCLIIAVWQAISGRAAAPVVQEPLVEAPSPQE